ncbi:SoxR reducing system RseC family protein [Halomonas sp. GXIMD04776]|uniref:SoxR reducing system RseC family protein n=1 Tax=Halomonas sp. GXIMD04776 TaxID=3415605 RepID=UPI003CABA15A
MSEQETTQRLTAHCLEERAVVVALFAGGAWVEARPQDGCHGCTQQGCGAGLVARRRLRHLSLYTDAPLRVGDRVRLGLPARGFLYSALVVYGVPLLIAITAGGLAERWVSLGNMAVPLVFVGGLLVGSLLSRYWLQRHPGQYHPILLAVEPH